MPTPSDFAGGAEVSGFRRGRGESVSRDIAGTVLGKVGRWAAKLRREGTTRLERLVAAGLLALVPLGVISAVFTPASASQASAQAPGTSDPVIAAAGDIACDPTNSNFNSGNGSTNSCRQK